MSGTLQPFAPSYPISWPLRVASVLRAVWITFVTDCPLTWWCLQGKRNDRADMEGPLYVPGAPNRQLEPGKAVVATIEDLKEFKPFVVKVTVLSPSGDPLPNVKLDWWQATTAGEYYYRSYGLRGKFVTDENGQVEVLTIAPGNYGPIAAARIGHFHIRFEAEDSSLGRLTTQVYVCRGNDAALMKHDVLNKYRKTRPQNLLTSYSTDAAADNKFMDFPEFDFNDLDTAATIKWWDQRLAEQAPGEGLKVVSYGSTTFTLHKRS